MATAELPARNLAAVVARLGGVPLDRIRPTPAPGTATEADLLKVGGPTCELIDGVLVEKAMGTRESLLAAYIIGLLRSHVDPDDLGVVFGADGFIRIDEDQVRAPDATFIPWSAFPGGEPPEGEAFWSVAPGLVVEVLRPTNTRVEVERKLGEWFAGGTKLAWVIDPRLQTARVYTSLKRFRVFDATAVLDGGKVLPGFKLPLADLFAATRPRKKKPR